MGMGPICHRPQGPKRAQGLAGVRANGRRGAWREASPEAARAEAMDEAAGTHDVGQERRQRAAGGAVVVVVAGLAGAAPREGR